MKGDDMSKKERLEYEAILERCFRIKRRTCLTLGQAIKRIMPRKFFKYLREDSESVQ